MIEFLFRFVFMCFCVAFVLFGIVLYGMMMYAAHLRALNGS